MRTSAGPGRALVQAVSFLTCLGRAGTPGPGAVAWFPVVGAGVGLAVGGVWWGAARLWPPLPAAVLAVAADLVLTNLLHVDGLADAADGLLPHLDRERRLAVMAEPTTGAFGVAAVATVLVARTAAMASTRAVPLLVAALWCLSRTAMAVTTTAVPYARPGGLATRFIGSDEPGRRGRVRTPVVAGVVGASGALALGWASGAPRGPVAVATSAIGAMAVVALARRRVGGFTGDVLGASGMVGETTGLLVAAARW